MGEVRQSHSPRRQASVPGLDAERPQRRFATSPRRLLPPDGYPVGSGVGPGLRVATTHRPAREAGRGAPGLPAHATLAVEGGRTIGGWYRVIPARATRGG